MISLDDCLNGIDDKMRASKEKVLYNQFCTNKPIFSFGLLEKYGYRLSQIIGLNKSVLNKRIVVFAADNGVSKMGLSVFKQSHTVEVVTLLKQGKTPLNKISSRYNIPIWCIDIGLNGCCEEDEIFISRKVGHSTKNIFYEDAMPFESMLKAIAVGIEIAEKCSKEGIDIVALGEVGIGNTISASAITSIVLELDAKDVTGRGTGIDNNKLSEKYNVVSEIVDRCRHLKDDPLALLAAAGSYEIIGSVGFLIGCAYYKIPVIIDGFITGVSALLACCISPNIRKYLFASHMSAEPGHKHILKKLDIKPVLDLKMRFGLATGAAIAMQLYDVSYLLTNNYDKCSF